MQDSQNNQEKNNDELLQKLMEANQQNREL